MYDGMLPTHVVTCWISMYLPARLPAPPARLQVASVMIADAERWHDARRSGGEQAAQPKVEVMEMGAIQKYT